MVDQVSINDGIRQAVILAGGFGTRLGDKTRETPKPLLPVGGQPFLGYVLWNLQKQGVTKVVLCIGYLAHRIVSEIGTGKRYGLQVEYVIEEKPADTGGALLLAASELEEQFFVLNGDTLFDADYRGLASLLTSTDSLTALALRQVPDVGRYGSVQLTGSQITQFGEKSGGGPGLISGGVYAMHKEALSHLSSIPCSIERDLLPALAAQGRLSGLAGSGYFIDIGLPETLDEANRTLPEWQQPLISASSLSLS